MRRNSKAPAAPGPFTDADKREYRRIHRDIRIARHRLYGTEEPEETFVAARARIVQELLATSWSVRTFRRSPTQRRMPELHHPDRPYKLSFYGCGLAINGDYALDDYRGWPLDRLIRMCDERATAAARKRLQVREALDELRAGVPGIPWELVKKSIQARLDAWFDEKRARPPEIPEFSSEAEERRFWAQHDVLEYFAEPDFLDTDVLT